jgi:phosphonopyruvate decarboxylase
VIKAEHFVEHLERLGVRFFAGVPDSLLKNLGDQLSSERLSVAHCIAANEGAAVGMAIGHHLRTGETPAVYMQNSGIGNAVNPILSIADRDVYSIPMLLILGWRGRPGTEDEPQHVKQGRIMEPLLNAMEIPFAVLPSGEASARATLDGLVSKARSRSAPVALLVERGVFADPATRPEASTRTDNRPSREEALRVLADLIGTNSLIVSTTGMLSRELFEHRVARGDTTSRDFLTVGGMGHASSIALGIARSEPSREVWCLDGDGALLMHAGSLAVIGQLAPPRYFHVVFNNGVHDSVGGQPTAIRNVNVPQLALANGYSSALSVGRLSELASAIDSARRLRGPALIELLVRPGSRPDLGRPTTSPADNKAIFMRNIDIE